MSEKWQRELEKVRKELHSAKSADEAAGIIDRLYMEALDDEPYAREAARQQDAAYFAVQGRVRTPEAEEAFSVEKNSIFGILPRKMLPFLIEEAKKIFPDFKWEEEWQCPSCGRFVTVVEIVEGNIFHECYPCDHWEERKI